jgi:hypothetical protein
VTLKSGLVRLLLGIYSARLIAAMTFVMLIGTRPGT